MRGVTSYLDRLKDRAAMFGLLRDVAATALEDLIAGLLEGVVVGVGRVPPTPTQFAWAKAGALELYRQVCAG